MSSTRSIEWRLTAWYAVMLFFGFVAVALVAWSSVSYAAEAAVDEQLAGRMTSLVETVAGELAEGAEEEGDEFDFAAETEEELFEYVTGLPERRYHQVRHADGRSIFPADPEDTVLDWRPADAERGFFSVSGEAAPYRIVVQRVTFGGRPYDVLLATSLDGVFQIRRYVIQALAIASPIALLLACGGGYVIARRALRPVNALTDAAAAITVHDLERRIPTPGTGDALDRLASAFNEMLSRLQSSVARLEQFSADASHELRTPLSVIRTTAELALRHGRSGDDYRRDLREIHEEAERLTNLISVLLTLAREEGGNGVPMADFDLVPMVSRTCCTFKTQAEDKGLALELETPDEPVMVFGNEPSLRRLLSSLLENALEHTSKGTVRVSVERNGTRVKLGVRDTGEGIPADAIEHVFDRFFRADASRSSEGHHAGLGLSIAKRIAELHGAELVADSQKGDGAEFIALLPVGETDRSHGTSPN